MGFGALLKLLRTGAGVGLRQLASEIGVSSAYISRVEHGHDAPPTPDRLVEIARVLRLPPDVLIELSDHVTPVVTRYLERVPNANALFVEIARRDLSRAQIERLREILDDEFPRTPAAASSASLSSVLAPERIVVGLACASLEDAVDVAVTRLSPDIGLGAKALARGMMAREAQSLSTVGHGIAMPHVASPALRATEGVLLTSPQGLTKGVGTGADDDVSIRLIFAFATPDQPPGSRARLLAAFARLAKSAAFDKLVAARTPDEVLRVVAAYEAQFG